MNTNEGISQGNPDPNKPSDYELLRDNEPFAKPANEMIPDMEQMNANKEDPREAAGYNDQSLNPPFFNKPKDKRGKNPHEYNKKNIKAI